jgi:hypothetical protein
MTISFPTNPTIGDTVTGSYGEVYTWDGVKWTLTALGSPDGDEYLPLTGGTIVGNLSVTGQVVIGASGLAPNQLTVGGQGISYLTLGAIGGNIGFGITGGVPWIFQNGLAVTGLVGTTGGVMTGPLTSNSNITTSASINAGAATLGSVIVDTAGDIATPGNITANYISSNGGIAAAGDLSVTGNSYFTGFISVQGVTYCNGADENGNGLAVQNGGAWINGNVVAAGSVSGVWVLPVQGDNTGYCGSPGDAWAAVCSYDFAQQSDPRGKRDMAPAPSGALDKVNALEVINYRTMPPSGVKTPKGKSEPDYDKLRTGFDASAVYEVHPDAVTLDADENPSGYSLSDMNALLWQAVQELSAKVAELESKLESR